MLNSVEAQVVLYLPMSTPSVHIWMHLNGHGLRTALHAAGWFIHNHQSKSTRRPSPHAGDLVYDLCIGLKDDMVQNTSHACHDYKTAVKIVLCYLDILLFPGFMNKKLKMNEYKWIC